MEKVESRIVLGHDDQTQNQLQEIYKFFCIWPVVLYITDPDKIGWLKKIIWNKIWES